MKRIVYENLLAWKGSSNRKPMLIRGARQVGKTWLMKRFGKSEYESCAYVNFESNKRLKNIFEDDFDIDRILMAIEIETGVPIRAESTLIIFDEIQEAKGALTSLKYFQENAPQYHIISAGSLLGVALSKHTSFPVGKVDFLDLYPMNFFEFMNAMDEKRLVKLLKSADWKLITGFKSKFIRLLKQYYFIGGMPAAVLSFSKNKDFNEVRTIQKQILLAYEQDFAKHAPNEIVPRIRMLWNSIPAQLAKENKKFIYGLIKTGARARDFELAISWLIDCGLLHRVNRVNTFKIPLKAYEDFSAFKLFLVDVGLLGAMVNLDVKTLLEGNTIFKEFKGALTEQYVLQQLITTADTSINYWTASNASAEIDFVLQYNDRLAPIEVKAEENLQAKSLKVVREKYKLKTSIRTSMADYRNDQGLINVPLYGVSMLINEL